MEVWRKGLLETGDHPQSEAASVWTQAETPHLPLLSFRPAVDCPSDAQMVGIQQEERSLLGYQTPASYASIMRAASLVQPFFLVIFSRKRFMFPSP